MAVQNPAIQPRPKGNADTTRYFTELHIKLYRLTGGVLGRKFGKYVFLLLTAVGRKSGKERVTPLFYQAEGGRFLVIASNWGGEKDPLWWLNLQANPRAHIQIGRRTIAVTATRADPEEHKRLWPEIAARYSRFARYQAGITREIPIVILTPES